MLFIDNKYTRRYDLIISSAQLRNFTTKKQANAVLGYVERHHVIPRSLGGSNTKDNLIYLTPREHFICHLLLVKMTVGEQKSKMALAAFMLTVTSTNQHRHTITSRTYARLKTNFSAAKVGKPSPNKGKKITDEGQLETIRESVRLREEKYASGELSRGNTGNYKRTDDHIQQLRNAVRTRPGFSTKAQTKEARNRAAANISKANKGRPAHNKGVAPSQISCLCCKKVVDIRNFTRWHKNNCKLK